MKKRCVDVLRSGGTYDRDLQVSFGCRLLAANPVCAETEVRTNREAEMRAISPRQLESARRWAF